MALTLPTFPGGPAAGGGGGGATGFDRGWTYLAKADATYWAAQHTDGGGAWYNKVIASTDTGTQWEVEVDNDQYTSNAGAGYKVSSCVGWGSYWFWDLPDSATFNKSNKVILKLELVDFTVMNKNCMVVLGLADPGASVMGDPARWAALGGFSNDSNEDGGGLIQPDARYGVKAGGSNLTNSAAMNATSGAITTAIIEVTKNSGSIMNVQTSFYRPSPSGGAAKLAFTYSATANRPVGDLKIFLQVGRTGGSNSDTEIHFKPYYLSAGELDETDWGA